MAKTIESDVVIIGAGISAAMVAEKLTEETDAKVVIVEAGDKIFNLEERFDRRARFLAYRENPWLGDHIRGQTGTGIQSRSMAVGGLALHWGGTTPRYSPEDFRVRSIYGVGYDWPFTYDDLDPFYQEAEERIGVAGSPGPAELDPRSEDYPLPPLPVSYNLAKLEEWGEKSGIPFWRNPVAKNSVPYQGRNVCTRCDTCSICPTGAKYTPDFTFQRLLSEGRIELYDRTLVRQLELAEGSDAIDHAVALDRDAPDESIHFRANTFVLASGYCWSTHLLLLSRSDRFPNGVANRSGMVGKFVTGHRSLNTYVEVPMKLYPGVYRSDSLLSKKFQRERPERGATTFVFGSRTSRVGRGSGTTGASGFSATRSWTTGRSGLRPASRACALITTSSPRKRARSPSTPIARTFGEILCRGSTSPTASGRRSSVSTRKTAFAASSSKSFAPEAGRLCRRASTPCTTIRAAAAAWAPIRRRASSTPSADRTITRIYG